MAARPCMDDTLLALADSFESLQAAAPMESAPAPQISLALSLRVPLIQEYRRDSTVRLGSQSNVGTK